MPKAVVHYRNIGIKGPGDLALRPVTWPLDLGAGRLWFTKQPRALHVAVKRFLLLGPIRVHSIRLPGKSAPRGGVSAPGNPASTRRYHATTVKSLAQPINHGGTVFTVGRINR